MSASVARSERILNRLADRTGLTTPAVEWLKTTLDPFHDNPLHCTGVPDGSLGNSVVQCIKKSITIQAPTGITTGTWDCNIKMLPFSSNNAAALSFQNAWVLNYGNGIQFRDGDIPFRAVGPINIVSYPTGDATEYSNSFLAGQASDTTHATTNVFLDASYATGEYRVISQGFEVINTTAELYTQGLCTVYRTPVPALSTTSTCLGHITTTDIKGYTAFSALNIPKVPASINEALALPNTKQWKAKEGCYVVAHLNDLDTPIRNNSYVQPVIQRSAAGAIEYAMLPTYVGTAQGSGTMYGMREIQWANMDISGAFLTGLHPSTTLTFNWNIYIERFPSVLESDLVVLAQPTPEYCPMALQLYKAIAMDLPVGVMQKENGLGDWFRDAVSTVADVVTPVLSMIPHPAAQMAAGIGKNFMSKPQGVSESPYQAEPNYEKPFQPRHEIPRERIRGVTIRTPVRVSRNEIKEVKKEIKREVKPFLKKSKMSVMPSAKKGHKK